MVSLLARGMGFSILLFARFITAVRGDWAGAEPSARVRIYFANHTSMGDFILVWTVIPSWFRHKVRPVAGADYWLKTKLREFVGKRVFNAVLIDRTKATARANPLVPMTEALEAGQSLILFPEGTRNMSDKPLLPFKAGLFHLAKSMPDVELVPCWIENLNRVMPKGEIVPIPLLCRVVFGAPLQLREGEAKADFLHRAEQALLSYAPAVEPQS